MRGRVAGVALTALAGLLLGTALGWAIDRPVEADAGAGKLGPIPTPRKAVVAAPPSIPKAPDPASTQRSALRKALLDGQREAQAMGGTVEAAVMAPGWERPVVVGNGRRHMRMWSMAKAVSAVALRQETDVLPKEVADAMRGALTRSENCAQRRVILELQRQAGGPEQARERLTGILAVAGARARIDAEPVAPVSECRDYLAAHGKELEDPFAPALQLGVAEWTVRDAVRFAFALMTGVYRNGDLVLADMGRSKGEARDVEHEPLKIDPDFGAGKVDDRIAYKGGWGGIEQGNYLVGQLGVFPESKLAFAVMFHPDEQPPTEDPGLTEADNAIQAVLRPVANALTR